MEGSPGFSNEPVTMTTGGYFEPSFDGVFDEMVKEFGRQIDNQITGGNKMTRKEIEILAENNKFHNMQLKFDKFSDRGFVVRLLLENGESKKEFVEYGENMGKYINELVQDFVFDIQEQNRIEQRIEQKERELKELKARR